MCEQDKSLNTLTKHKCYAIYQTIVALSIESIVNHSPDNEVIFSLYGIIQALRTTNMYEK